MKCLWAIPLASAALFGQQLSVKSATAHRVELVWTGTAAGSTVERKTGPGAYEKVGDATAASFTDDKIAAFATYKYHLKSQSGAVSNEVTVGPPPSGVNVVARSPKGTEANKYGTNSAIALDENGDPSIAFFWIDPNGDNDYTDNTIYFVHWNRATYSWKVPVKVAVVGEITSQRLEPISVACDTASGTFAVSYPKHDTPGAQVAISRDGGATWTASAIAGDMAGTTSSTSMAAAGGHWHLAVASDQAGVHYLTGDIAAAPSEWKSTAAPTPVGGRILPNGTVSLATDAAGKAVIGYWVIPEEGDNYQLMVSGPDSGQAIKVTDSRGHSCDDPSLRLNIAGGKTRVLLNCALDAKDTDFSIWYTASSGGAWSAPVKLPVDGPRSTNSPMAVGADSHGRIIAAYASNGGSASTVCGYPVLAISTDGVKWAACGPGKRSGEMFDPQPSTITGVFTPDDRFNVVWHQEGENKFAQGLLLWRE